MLHERDGRKDAKEGGKAARREASFDSKNLLIPILSFPLVFVNGLNIFPIVLLPLVLSKILPFYLPGSVCLHKFFRMTPSFSFP